FLTDPAPTRIDSLSLHDALPIYHPGGGVQRVEVGIARRVDETYLALRHRSNPKPSGFPVAAAWEGHEGRLRRSRLGKRDRARSTDRKSTRLNSSHSQISYAVFCL